MPMYFCMMIGAEKKHISKDIFTSIFTRNQAVNVKRAAIATSFYHTMLNARCVNQNGSTRFMLVEPCFATDFIANAAARFVRA